MHFCQDEWNALMALMASLPVIGFFLLRGKHFLHRIFHGKASPKLDGCCPPAHHHKHELSEQSNEEIKT